MLIRICYGDELYNVLKDVNREESVISEKPSDKISVCISMCLGHNEDSKKTLEFIRTEFEKNKFFFQSFVYKYGLPVFKKVVFKLLEKKNIKEDTNDKIVREYLFEYLSNLSNVSMEDAIEVFYKKIIKKKVSFIFFRIDFSETDNKLTYHIENSPCFFGFIESNFHKSNDKLIFNQVYKAISTTEEYTEFICKTIELAFEYYLKVVFLNTR